MNAMRKVKSRIVSIAVSFGMLLSFFIGSVEEVHASENNVVYEPLIINSSTLNASTVWGEGDTNFTMDKDGGFFSSAKQTDGALPNDGKIMTSDDIPYQLAWTGNSPYEGNDSIRFVGTKSGDYVTSNPITMKINTYGVYDKIAVLGTAGGFANNELSLNFKVTLTYADNTQSITTYSLYDWYKNKITLENNGMGYAVFKRLNSNGSTIDGDFSAVGNYSGNGGPMLQSKQIECDETKVLKNITFQIAETSSNAANEHGIYAAIYAVTGITKSGAPAAPSISLASTESNSFTVEWDEVEGAASYAVDVSEYPNFQDARGEASFVPGYLNKAETKTRTVISGLEEGKKYYCRVRSVGEDGAQSISSAVIPNISGVVITTNNKVKTGTVIESVSINNNGSQLLNADIFTNEEKQTMTSGVDSKVWLEISPTTEGNLTDAEKQQIEQKVIGELGTDAVINYFEADLFKQVGEGEISIIGEPGVNIAITVKIDESLINNDSTAERSYKLIRSHEEQGGTFVVEIINGDFDRTTGELTFETDRFSTYAIVYQDAEVTNPEDGNSGENPGENSGENPGENSGGNPGENSGGNPGGNNSSNAGSSSGSSSGSDDTSSTPTSIPTSSPTSTPITVPVSGGETENALNIKATISGETAEVSELSADEINKVANNETNTKSIEINLSETGNKVKEVALPVSSLNEIARIMDEPENRLDNVTIKLSTATVEVSEHTLKAVLSKTTGNDLRLVVDDIKKDTLNDTQKNAVKDQNVHQCIDAYFISNGVRIGDFQGGTATIRLPFNVPEGLNGNGFSVWYVADDGSIEKHDTRYVNGELVFTVSHFSNYVVVYNGAVKDNVPKTGEAADYTTLVWTSILAIGVLGLVLNRQKRRQ